MRRWRRGRGAAAVFGPQKGATPHDVATLDAGLARLAGILGGDPDEPGAGAARTAELRKIAGQTVGNIDAGACNAAQRHAKAQAWLRQQESPQQLLAGRAARGKQGAAEHGFHVDCLAAKGKAPGACLIPARC